MGNSEIWIPLLVIKFPNKIQTSKFQFDLFQIASIDFLNSTHLWSSIPKNDY